MDLFESNVQQNAPLADKMRPRTLDEFFGQEHIIGKGRLLRRAIQADKLTSSIFYGPPGTGKTTLAHIIANTTGASFHKLNAVTSGVKDVRKILDEAESRLRLHRLPTYLLLDECHRWSKAQSDSILPAIEKGIIRFIGSTTENPMIAMTNAIVSRCRLFQFFALKEQDVIHVLKATISDKTRGFGNLDIDMSDDAFKHIADIANGDARSALNAIELAVLTTDANADGKIVIDLGVAEESIQQRALRCDDREYYNMLSAFCKSLRGSSTDGALFWFARLILAGVDPRVIVRRMIAHASEDVGVANPSALTQACAAADAIEYNGFPEARLNIAQAIIMICESPKSNATCIAVDTAFADAKKAYQVEVMPHLRYSHVRGAKEMGNGVGYKYAHDYKNHYTPQQYLPDQFKDSIYYTPSDEGYEKKIKEIRSYLRNDKEK
jgi:putative ATPase